MSILLLGLIAFLGFSLFSKNYFNFQPQGKRLQQSTSDIDQYLKLQQSQLVAFGKDELELLSGNRVKSGRSGLFSNKTEGILTSIYHEPFLAYKKVMHSSVSRLGVLGIATSDRLFMYILKKDHIDIFIDREPIGTIKGNGKLVNAADRVVIGEYEIKNEASYLIRILNKPQAEVKVHIEHESLPQRVVDIFGPETDEIYAAMEVLVYYLVGLGIK